MGFDKAAGGFYFGEFGYLAVPLRQTKIVTTMKEELYYVVDSLGVAQPEFIESSGPSIPQLFVEGGLAGMIAITLLLIALFVAAWKAPRWVKEIGIGALVISVFWTLQGLAQAFHAIQMFGDVSMSVICGGLKVCLISVLYGLMVYFVSLIIRIIQKPRI